MLAQGGPLGLSSVWGQLIIVVWLVVVILLAVRWFWNQRNR
ncbi:hypothetical protein FHX42_003009 [Saccharopolyspora lacisalsi]|uniref:Uncharacterized protein n=1 Tax=Halosaccharopolyspora lacisalsi TaxID=1000566 RepID=A0A839DX76_9PSEU|nr:hypothetical protein [Halosaccharopolyspora lacisalsi]